MVSRVKNNPQTKIVFRSGYEGKKWWLIILIMIITYLCVGMVLSLKEHSDTFPLDVMIVFILIAIIRILKEYFITIVTIKIIGDELILTYMYKTYTDAISNFTMKEKWKTGGSKMCYRRMVISNKKFKRKFYVDSDVYTDYEKLKKTFIEMNLLEGKNV